MLSSYSYPRYPYRIRADQSTRTPAHHPVIVVGAGPVGLCCAIDLALHGQPVVVLDEDDTVSVGSRAICFAKRTLEILDRLGCAQAMVDKGVVWNLGRVFFQDRQIYEFNLLPESDHRRPAFINLQQYWFEQFLVNRAMTLPGLDLRWKNRVQAVRPAADGVAVDIDTPDGPYRLRTDWLVACDGARSPIRHMLGLESRGQVFQDRFLIADVIMEADFPTQRWFWFDPPFHRNHSVLLHRQADNVWRIDFQLGPDADPDEERRPERVTPRIRAMLGPDARFELEWVSVYTFTCRRMERFRHGRILFAGDACHQVSPFGARGANSGIQDTDNLVWKLAMVIAGQAPISLLDSYDGERGPAADENILNSTRSTDFITPKSAVSRAFRDAVLTLAEDYPFARPLVNSGRLSRPAMLERSPLNTADADPFAPDQRPGSPCADAPLADGWLLDHLGNEFCLLLFTDSALDASTHALLGRLGEFQPPLRVLQVARGPLADPPGGTTVVDVKGLVRARYDATHGTCYLIRPDQHVAARWRRPDAQRLRAALARAIGREEPCP